ncbi:tetratricopeptide repeat protein [Archangium violaceum]|nr:tetratricopeptide repeat protein [Archangium violaceum]QRO02694.1 tetratricopeptide repeat protein [Archangium violaceum]
MTKQELRAPDAFQLYGAEASDWLMKRRQLIGTAVAVLIVGGLIAALVQYFSNRSEERAAKQLGQALEVLTRPVVVTNEQLQPMEGEQAPFKSDKEKDEAIVKSLTDFRAGHKGTEAAATAALPLGKAEYRLGNHDGALAAFGEFIKEARKDDPLMASAYEGQGYAHEAKGQLDQALEAFKGMAKVESGEFLQGMGLYHQARILVAQGKKDEAAQILADLKASQTNTAAGRLATERLAVLAAQGVKVPEPKTPPATAQTQDAG